jgi:hypothetical protein
MSNSLNLQEIDQEQAINLCRFFIRAEQNIFLFGRRGVGKTEIAIQAATDCGYKINYVNLSVIERPDLAGYPDLHAPGDIVNFKSPHFLPRLLEKSKSDSVILFDEVDKAPSEITSPLLEILRTKSLNGKKLNTVSCILTGNLLNEGAYSNDISSALLDRGAKYILQFNFDKWLNWAKIHNVHDLITGFLMSHPNLACGETETTFYATPSPRGWVLASDALYRAKETKTIDIDTVTSIISGFVGLSAGLQFKIWYEYYREFEPFILSLIETGECAKDYASLQPTEQLVFCITACHLCKLKVLSAQTKKRFKYLENVCHFMIDNAINKEIQLIALQNAFPFELITTNKLYECKIFFDLVSKLQEGVSIKK